MDDKIKCPYCGQEAMSEVETGEDETFAICKIKKENTKQMQMHHIKLYGCTNCGSLKLTSDVTE